VGHGPYPREAHLRIAPVSSVRLSHTSPKGPDLTKLGRKTEMDFQIARYPFYQQKVDEVQGQKGKGQGHRIDILLSISGSGFKVH